MAPADLEAAVLGGPMIAHGFGPCDQAVAADFTVVRVKQVHEATLLHVGAKDAPHAGDADALMTAEPGVAVAIATADCVPVLLAAPDVPAVAAVHAGWRGTIAGIVPVALDELRRRYGVEPASVRAAMGPSIGGCCYEVESELGQRFRDRFGDEVEVAWREGRPGKGYLDLRRVNRLILERAGVPAEAVEDVGPCTLCGGGPFASYRGSGPRAGRQLSWIAIRPRP